MKKITFIGLGVMGYPMAGHLANAGYDVTVFNRNVNKADHWGQDYNGTVAHNLVEAVNEADVVVSCLTDDASLEAIFFEQALLEQLSKGTLIIDHTTCTAEISEHLYKACQQRGLFFLDAPVTGGEVGAVKGLLSIMVGGDQAVFDSAVPLLRQYASHVNYVGSAGAGQRCKMVNQLCVAGVLQGLAEGLTLAKKAGLSAETVLASLEGGAAGSWQMSQRTKTMMADEFDFGFAVRLMRKDLNICIQEAQRHDLELPMATQVNNTYQTLGKEGYDESDTSVLIKQFDKSLSE